MSSDNVQDELRQNLMSSKALAVDLQAVMENESTFYTDLLVDFIAAEVAKGRKDSLLSIRGWIDRNHYQPVNDTDRWVQASREIMDELDDRISTLQSLAGQDHTK